MSDLMLCYELDCQEDQKYSEDSKQFMKKDGPHGGHKMAYFDDLCDSFTKKFSAPIEDSDYNSLMTKVYNMYDNFKKDITVIIDLNQQNLIKWIQSNTHDDKGVQFYLSIIEKDLDRIKIFSDSFYQFDQPEKIKEAYCNNIKEAYKKFVNSQNMMSDVLAKIALLNEQHINGHKDDKKTELHQKKLESENINKIIIHELTTLQEKLNAMQFEESQNIIEALESQQEIINSFFNILIRKNNNADLENKFNKGYNQIKKTKFQVTLAQLQEISNQRFKIMRANAKNAIQVTPSELRKEQIEVSLSIKKQSFSFSNKYKSSQIIITSPNVATRPEGIGNDIAVMVPALNQQESVTFGFKIQGLEANSQWTGVGVCYLNTIIQKEFLQNGWAQLGHGCYMVSGQKCSTSSTDSLVNGKMTSFSFAANDTIYCTFDPTAKFITFKKASSRETLRMSYIPTAQQLHPCVMLQYSNNQVEFIQPDQIKDGV